MLLKDSAGCVIMESDAPYGTYDIRITENGKLGFTREGYVYEFDYSLPVGKRVALRMETTSQKTVLRTGFIRKKAVGQFVYDRVVRCSGIKNSTFSIPCSRLIFAIPFVRNMFSISLTTTVALPSSFS